MADEIAVFVTADELELARQIAGELVERRLVACVNIVPGIESIYRWQGAVQRDREVLLIIKTSRHRFAEIEMLVKRLHTYQLPEIIAVPIDHGSQEYLDWIQESIANEHD
jgi:periplasmic divalent cation tolerance protein